MICDSIVQAVFPQNLQTDKSITYLTKASNTYFIYALQANITIHIRRNLASKYMKIWHFDKS